MTDAEVREPLLVAVPVKPANQDAVKEERRGTWEAVVYARCGPEAFHWHADRPMAMHDEGRHGSHVLPQQVEPGLPVHMNDFNPHKPCPFMHDDVEGFEGQLNALPFMLRGQDAHSEPMLALVDPAVDAQQPQPYSSEEHPLEPLEKPIQAMLIAHSIVTVAAVDMPVVYDVQTSTATEKEAALNELATSSYEYGYAYQPDEMYNDDGGMALPEDEVKPQQENEDQDEQLKKLEDDDDDNAADDKDQEELKDGDQDMDLVKELVGDEMGPRMWVDPNVPADDDEKEHDDEHEHHKHQKKHKKDKKHKKEKKHKKKHDDDDLEEYLEDLFEDIEDKLEECAEKLGFAPCALLALTVSVAIYATYWAALRRKLMRERFGIAGDFRTDLLLWGCCSTCALAQETRTMIHNNVEEGIWQGAQQQQPSCVVWYKAPAPQKVVDNANAV